LRRLVRPIYSLGVFIIAAQAASTLRTISPVPVSVFTFINTMSEFEAEETTAKVRFEEPKRSRRSLSQLVVSVVDWWRSRTPEGVKDVWNLARWETQNVRCWRTLIFILLLITGACVSTFTYVFLRKEQDLDFEENVRYLSWLMKAFFPRHGSLTEIGFCTV
jgi:hypothetical protein